MWKAACCAQTRGVLESFFSLSSVPPAPNISWVWSRAPSLSPCLLSFSLLPPHPPAPPVSPKAPLSPRSGLPRSPPSHLGGGSAPAPPAHAALPLASPCSSPATHGWGSGGGKGRGQLGLMAGGTYVSVQICVEQHQGTGQGVGSVCSTSTGQGLEPLGMDRARSSPEPTPPSLGTWGTQHQHGAGSTQASG